VEWTEFDPEDAPEVLTGISPECQAEKCVDCPGVMRLAEHGDQPIFCVHDCHKMTVPN
jgi:hypothetical protein